MTVSSAPSRENGFTLVEVLVYSMLFVVVLGIVFGMFISVITINKTVQAVTTATTSAQLAADSVAAGIRNSSDFRLTTEVGDDQFLVARTALGGDSFEWTCAAWYYSAADGGSIRYTESDLPILPPTELELQNWTLLSEAVGPDTGATIFSATGSTLSISFTVATGDQPPVAITSSAVSRAGASGSLTCF